MDRPVVSVKQGKLQGIKVDNVLGGSYYAFRGIPYAAPPLGEFRFKDPQPPLPWSTTRDASKRTGDVCPQKDVFTNNIIGDENCLFLSVYTTSLTEKRPVLVWIHEGNYVTGGEKFYRPDYLVTKDIVIVCINFRVGALGFLNLGHKCASGNQGLKDQVMALKWIKENIENFGGDADNITVAGVNSGAASAHLLAMSPMSKGLFNRIILHSGVATGCSGTQPTEESVRRSFELAKSLGIKTKDPERALEELQNINATLIVQNQRDIMPRQDVVRVPLGPVIDSIADEPFLPQPVKELVKNCDNMPVMMGHADYEFASSVKENNEQVLTELEELFPGYIKLAGVTENEEELRRFGQEIERVYFHNRGFARENMSNIIRFLSDLYFNYDVEKFIEYRRNADRNTAPVYYFNFSYVGSEMTVAKALQNHVPMNVAMHLDELSYIFYLPFIKTNENVDPPAVGSKDRVMMEIMTRMWANFVKTGDPTPQLDEYVTAKWRAATEDDIVCMDIGEQLRMRAPQTQLSQICKRFLASLR